MKSRHLRFLALATALSLLLLALVGCGSKSSSSASGSTTSDSAASTDPSQEKISAKDTMVIGCYGEPSSMFPANGGKVPDVHFTVNLYETLVHMNEKGEIIPKLAESYKQLDEKTYEFKLRQGIKFHNGEELKASDVVFAMTHLAENPKTKTFSSGFDPTSFKAVDDYTVVLGTKTPFAPFLPTLCHPQMSIFSEKWYTEAGDKLDISASGTGPFQFVSWSEGENIILERFDGYWGEKAKMKTLNFRHIPEANSRTLELETGGIDLMTEVPGITLDQISSNPALKLWTTDSVGTSFLALNFDKELLKIPEVRQAIAHGIDNDALRKACLMDAATTANSYLPPSVPGAKLDLPSYTHDIAKSKELLTKAGYPNGITVPLAFFQSSDNRRMGEVLQAMLKDAGIILELQEMESAAYTPFLNTREQSAAITTLNNTLRDPHQTLSKLYSEACGVGGNRVNYNNPEMDKLLDQAAAETDWEKRAKLYDTIQTKLWEDTVWIPLYNLKVCTATTNKIRGFSLEYPASYQNYASCYFVD